MAKEPKWEKSQAGEIRKRLSEIKSKIRTIQADRDRQIDAAKKVSKYGREYTESRIREIIVEAKMLQGELRKEATILASRIKNQQYHFTVEEQSRRANLIPAPVTIPCDMPTMFSSEKAAVFAWNESLKVQHQMAEDMRRMRIRDDLMTAPIDYFREVIAEATEKSNYVVVSIAKQVAAGRKWGSDIEARAAKSATITAIENIKLPPAEQEVADVLGLALADYQAVESTAKEIETEGATKDWVQITEKHTAQKSA
jgi:hypothetical protein